MRSSAEAAIAAEIDNHSRVQLQAGDCDDFFAWIEVEHRKNTMSVNEAATLLSIDHAEAVAMIYEGSLCAIFDEATEDWLVKTACVRAQLAESISISSETGTGKVHHADGPSLHQTEEAADNSATPAPASTESGAHLDNTLPFDRAGITAKNVKALMDSLDFANVRLEGSMYRIGYLEAQVHSQEEQLKVLCEFRGRVARAILVERENDMLKAEMETLARTLSAREGNIAALHANNAVMAAKLAESENVVGKIQQQWWFRLFSRLFGFKVQ